MASSNRHWPSMFKSKPCNSHHQWQHDINPSLISNPCHKTPYSSGCEERSPEPKPRWNPKPEQIRILEAIFNSGMVNPPREEIRKIRAQLQEYGQVGDANVFYWFQNRKSRSKHKQRQVQMEKPQVNAVPTAISSSSSSSEKSSPRADKALALGGGTSVIDLSNSPTASVNQPYFQSHGDFPLEPFTFQLQAGSSSLSQGYCFSELSNIVQMPEPEIGPCSGLLNELMNQEASKKQMEENQTYVAPPPPPVTAAAAPPPIPTNTSSALSEIRGVGESGGAPPCPARSTVFINDVAFEVSVGPINLREAFGEEAVLIHSSGQPVLTNEWGVTLQSLQHGAFYYLVRLV